MRGKIRDAVRDNRGFIVFLLLLGVVRTAIADYNPVPTGSMRPTLLEGDVVLVNRLAYNLKIPLTNIVVAKLGEPARGDIVTFFSPKDGTRLIKRLVAVPGDVIEMRDKVVIVNGEPARYEPIGRAREEPQPGFTIDAYRLDEHLPDKTHVVQWFHLPDGDPRDSFGPYQIPADHYLMLGDNRDNSADSRVFGLVPRELLIGRAFATLVSADITTHWSPRFERFGRKLN